MKRPGIVRTGCSRSHWRRRLFPPRRRSPVNLILNWTPTADHSPFYYAKAQGWYEKAGIDLTIETGKGSGVSVVKGRLRRLAVRDRRSRDHAGRAQQGRR